MLKLIACEFAKLKRKRFITLAVISAFLFPVPLTYLMTRPNMLEKCETKKEAFDMLFHLVLGYGAELLLPCILGVVAAILFFMERDNDTFKSLRTVPVTSTQMVLAKLAVLFIFGILFCIASTFATALGGSFACEVNGLAYKFFVSAEMGIFITAGALPLVVLVIFFSRTYIFSVLLCIFYSVLSMSAESLIGQLPAAARWGMPIVLTNLWTAGELKSHGYNLNLKKLESGIPSTAQTALILGSMAVLSFLVIDFLYKRRGE